MFNDNELINFKIACMIDSLHPCFQQLLMLFFNWFNLLTVQICHVLSISMIFFEGNGIIVFPIPFIIVFPIPRL